MSSGRLETVNATISMDQISPEAPVGKTSNVSTLCHLNADVSGIELEKKKGQDGEVNICAQANKLLRESTLWSNDGLLTFDRCTTYSTMCSKLSVRIS